MKKKNLLLILILAIVKLIIQLLGNRHYGFHRDELLHLSVSEHLDWGFMEFPPLIGLLGKLSYWLFDYLWGVRLFPTIAGVLILVICCLMVIELGGKSKAVFLAGICVLAFLSYYRNHTLFQPVAFDQFFWVLGFYFLIKFIRTNKTIFLFFLFFTLGFGLMNKYTMALWGFGIIIGFVFYEKGKLFTNKWFYFAGLITLIIVLPNIIWQAKHDFPFLLHLKVLKEKQLNDINFFAFGMDVFNYPYTLIVSLFGLLGFFLDTELKKFKIIGIAFLVTFFTMWLLQSKSYYVYGIYPVAFAGGAVIIENLLHKKPAFIYLIAFFLLIPIIKYIPHMTPILPIEKYVSCYNIKENNGRVELTGDYADMFGWEEQVSLVDSVYQSLSEKEKQNCVIWAENYGEAGAVEILGKKYGLPNPVSRHGSFWLWGYGNKDAAVWISLGNEKSSVEYVFKDVELVKIISHKYAIGEENGIPLYICRNPQIDIEKWWKDYEKKIFN